MNDEQRKRLAEELLVRDAERKAAERKADRLEAEVERLREENDDLVTQLSTAVEDVLPPVERELSQALRERDGLRKALERIRGGASHTCVYEYSHHEACGPCLARAALDGGDR